ncbi:hypothetical protein [Nostoc sp. CCY 9925]|uniref:hypothetical protein n=1 Tax=Nostoc sp. CCY 9925 TaxID=3103865 RepID=UPI0039C691C8
MPNCPICQTEYVENHEECSICAWDLTITLQNISPIPSGFGPNSEGSQKILHSIQKVWNKAQTSTNLPCAASKSEELESFQLAKQDLEENKKLVSKLKSQLEEVTKQRDDLQKKLEQFQGKDAQNLIFERVRNLTERVYKLEISDKENIHKFQTIEKNVGDIQKNLVFFEDIDTENLKELPLKISHIETDIQEIREKIASLESINPRAKANSSSEEDSQKSSSELKAASSQETKISLTIEENEIIKGYNTYQQNVPPPNAIEVNATEDSINNNRLTGQNILLTKITRGNYWIVNQGGFNYLVPKKNLIINQHSYSTAEALFECWKYQPGDSRKFQLLKPAKVFELPEGEKWRLDNKGILEF